MIIGIYIHKCIKICYFNQVAKIFISIFLLPFFLNKIFLHSTNIWDTILWLVIATVILALSYYLLEDKIKSETKSYTQNSKEKTQFIKVLDELKPSSLNVDEIKEQFDYALKQNYFVCELSQFEDLLKLNNPNSKIFWLAKNVNKTSNRRLILSFLNDLFEKQFDKISDSEVSNFVNKYFEFDSFKNLIKENPLDNDKVSKWRRQKINESKAL